MSEFAVGEVAVYVNVASHYNGCDVTIVAIHPHAIWASGYSHLNGLTAYEIAGPFTVAEPDKNHGVPVSMLRKKPPPQRRQELGEWELCPWRPVGLPETVEVSHAQKNA